MKKLSLLKRCIKFVVLFIGAVLCQIFAAMGLTSLNSLIHLDRVIMIPLLLYGPVVSAAVLVIGILGAYWLNESAYTGFVLSLLLGICWFGFLIAERPPELDFYSFLKFSEIPVVTLAGGSVYATICRLKHRAKLP